MSDPNRRIRRPWGAVFAATFFVAGTGAIQGQANGSTPLRIVLVEVDGTIDCGRFLDTIRRSAIVETADASNIGMRLADLGEGDIGEAARRFRTEWPADVYLRLAVSYEEGDYHPIDVPHDNGWVTCKIAAAMRDAQTGRLLSSFSVAESGDWAFTYSVKRPRENVASPTAWAAATARATRAAVKRLLKNLEGRLTAK